MRRIPFFAVFCVVMLVVVPIHPVLANAPGIDDVNSRWNTAVLIRNVSSRYLIDYPRLDNWGAPRIFATATGLGDVMYLAYYDMDRHSLMLARVDHGMTTVEKVDSSARPGGISLDVNPVTGTPAISYRALGVHHRALGTPIYAYPQDNVWKFEIVDADASHGEFTSLAFDGTGTPHIAYDDGISYSNLMYGTRNLDGTWTTEIADRGVGGHLGDAGKNPDLKITDAGVYIAHSDGSGYRSQRFTWKLTGGKWKSVTVDRGWGRTDNGAILGSTGVDSTVAIGPDGVATLVYRDARVHTLMKARGPLANNSFETAVLANANRVVNDNRCPVLVSKGKPSSGLTGGHLVFIRVGEDICGGEDFALSYMDIGADPNMLPKIEVIDHHAVACTVTSDSAGKPHIFYLDKYLNCIKHAWLA
jgi:hypothetical protein